uniref:bifunctional diguanylate cyclase/phosphodiesterase n=1 Tax=Agathobacter sp. TaxID=2021311 RepID=UPI004056FF15
MSERGLKHFFDDYCKMIKTIAPCMDDYLYFYDLEQDLYYISEKALERFAIPANLFSDVANTHRLFVHKDDVEKLLEDLERMSSGEQEEHNMEYRWIGKNEEPIWVNCRGRLIKDNQGKPVYMVGCVNEIGARQSADNISGLKDSSNIARKMDKICKKESNAHILYLGIDDFKTINERFGVVYGDYILKNVADCIVSSLSKGQTVYRVVADEFLITDFDSAEERDAVELYERIRTKIDEFIEDHEYEAMFTISAGVVTCRSIEELDYAKMLKISQFALNQAKERGKNQAYIFQMYDYNEFVRKREILRSIRTSIADSYSGFEMYFQPIMRTEDDSIPYSAEALLRYRMENGKNIPPVEFIPILEESGLIIPVGKWIMNQAMSFCKKRQGQYPDFKVNINVSYVQVLKSPFISEFFYLLREYGLSPSSIVIELTESGQVVDSPQIHKVWEHLRNHGVNIALDDFGTGYSNLLYISDMSPNVVKLDRGFTLKAMKSPFESQLMENTIQLVHSIGLKVCVEGVETQEELDRIYGIGADYIQGFYYGKPCSRKEFFEKF